jgi:Papain family cysteine protease
MLFGVLALACTGTFAANATTPAIRGVGAPFEALQIGKIIYQNVQFHSVTARNLIISHAGGVASVRPRDVSTELQAAFGDNPAAEAVTDAPLAGAQEEVDQKRAIESQARADAKRTSGSVQFDNLLQSFGQPPEIRASVDLRPRFLELGLNVKNQGPRPSCAVFAIVTALEFQNAQLTGHADKFSEEYLIWATCKILHRAPRVRSGADAADPDNPDTLEIADEGFALSEVVTALRSYGIPLQSSMPYNYAYNATVTDPPPDVVEQARNHRRVSIVPLPGRDEVTRLGNLIQTLNAGIPVAIGLRWPSWRAMRTAFLSGQIPAPTGGHAVALVGYENKTGAAKDTVFIFKNSWGAKWGSGGFGYVTYNYLSQYLGDAALLEVEPDGSQKPAP